VSKGRDVSVGESDEHGDAEFEAEVEAGRRGQVPEWVVAHNERLSALGNVVQSAGALEQAVLFNLLKLLDSGPAVSLLAMGESFGWLLGKLRLVATLYWPENLERKQKAIAAAEEAMRQRNRLLHASWVNVGDDAQVLKWARGGRMDLDKVTRVEIQRVDWQLRAAVGQIHEAFEHDGAVSGVHFHGEPPAS